MFVSQLETLESTGLIQLAQAQPEAEYLFRHALVQSAAYLSLLHQDRKRLHQAVGQAIERLYPKRLEEFAATLAHHFFEGEDNQRAFKYFVMAGDVAFGQYATFEAVTHYTRALGIAKQTQEIVDEVSWQHLYSRLGRALELNTQYQRALDVYVEMEKLAGDLGDPSMALVAQMERAKVWSTPGPVQDSAQGQILARQALELARQLDDRPAEARIYWILMLSNWPSRQFAQSLVYGERSLELARKLGLREQLAYTLQDIHRVYDYGDQPTQAKQALQEAQQLWRQMNNLPMLADSLASTADLLATQGDYVQALHFADEAYRLSLSIGNLWNQAFGRGVAGQIYVRWGDMGQAFETLQQAIRLSEQAGLGIMNVMSRLNLVRACMLLGAFDRAREILEEARGVRIRLDAFFQRFFDLQHALVFAQLNVQTGNLDAAQESLASVDTNFQPGAHLIEVELLVAREDYAGAVAAADQAIRKLDEQYYPRLLADLWYLKGKACLALADLEAAERALEQALAQSQALNLRHRLWRVLFSLSQVKAQQGDQKAAEGLRQQAQEVIVYIADRVDSSDLRACLLGLPDVRAIWES
jgi:tetratricopeptide (TPR) repeat protein